MVVNNVKPNTRSCDVNFLTYAPMNYPTDASVIVEHSISDINYVTSNKLYYNSSLKQPIL